MTDQKPETSRREVLSLGALGAGAAFGATLLAPVVARADNAIGLKIGLVDIGVVFKKYVRKETLEKEINAKKDELEKKSELEAQKLEGIRNNMKTLQPGSDLYRQRAKELKLGRSQLQVMQDNWQEDLKFQIENLTLMILDEIENRVKQFGSDNKYDLIVKIDKGEWAERVDERFQERIFRAQVSSLLYYDKKLDVTDPVLLMLNDATWLKSRENAKPGQPLNPQQPTPAPGTPTPPAPPAPPPPLPGSP